MFGMRTADFFLSLKEIKSCKVSVCQFASDKVGVACTKNLYQEVCMESVHTYHILCSILNFDILLVKFNCSLELFHSNERQLEC